MPAWFCLRVTPLLLCFCLAMLPSCGNHAFDVVRTAQANLSAGDDAAHLQFADFAPVELLDDQTIKLQHIARRELSAVKVHAMTLTVVSPGSSQDLTFLSRVDVVISAKGLPDKALATGQNFNPGQSLGVLKVSDADLLAYFADVDPTIRITGQGQAPLDLTVEAELALALQISSTTILWK